MLERPYSFTIDPFHQLARGLVFFGGGAMAGSTLYKDSSLYGNDGTLTNMDPATDWIAVSSLGRRGLELDKTAARQYVLLSTSAWSEKWTWAVWMQFLGGSGDTDEHTLIGSTTAFTANTTLTSSIIEDAAWHHVSFTYDGTNVNLYVDGVYVTQNALASYSYYMIHYRPVSDYWRVWGGNSGGAINIGNSTHSAADSLRAKIADPMFHSRVLTIPEIQTQASGDPMLGGLILPPARKWWPVSGGAAPTFAGSNRILGGGIVA